MFSVTVHRIYLWKTCEHAFLNFARIPCEDASVRPTCTASSPMFTTSDLIPEVSHLRAVYWSTDKRLLAPSG